MDGQKRCRTCLASLYNGSSNINLMDNPSDDARSPRVDR